MQIVGESGASLHPTTFRSFEEEALELRAFRAASEARSLQMLSAMVAFRDGDFSVRLPTDWTGTDGRIAEAFNQAIAQEERISREVEPAERDGRQGRPAQAAHVAARRDRRLGDARSIRSTR